MDKYQALRDLTMDVGLHGAATCYHDDIKALLKERDELEAAYLSLHALALSNGLDVRQATGMVKAGDAATDNKQSQDIPCPECGKAWPTPCEQTVCIELFNECIVCRFGVNGIGTPEELERLRKAAAQSQEGGK